ncbi:sensor histidine kinase [Microbacterium sp.]|uniref:sensor histidine kinase n=1 Tax=Microbacterium sp. TaxID=51671 RepID=UPI0039E26CCB
MSALLSLPAETAATRWLGIPRPIFDALAYGALAVALAAVGFDGLFAFASLLSSPVSAWWTLATALPAASLALWKHRAPRRALAAATAVTVIDALTVGGLIPVAVLVDTLYAAVVTASAPARSRLLRGTAGGVALFAAYALLRSGDVRAALTAAVQATAIGGVTYWFATSVAQSRQLMDQSAKLAELHRQAAADATARADRRRAEAVRVEREQMARELHDLVAGHVSAVAIRSEAALAAPSAADSAERRALRAIRDTSLRAHETLREMVAVLRSDGAPSVPARARVSVMVEAAQDWGLDVSLHDGLAGLPSDAVDQAVRRVVQEALANASRHAPEATVRVELAEDARGIRVTVVSIGGRDATGLSGGGWGLRLLRERVETLGGAFEAGPADGGWHVEAVLPREVGAGS